MKAIVCRRYGSPDVLECEEIPKPVPADDEVLIRVRAASVNPRDWHCMRGSPYVARLFLGLRAPKETWIGVDVAGEVEAAGRNVKNVKPGDAVFGTCKGSLAEYACASVEAFARKPANVPFEAAAAVPVAGYTALQSLRDKGDLRSGQSVLINGAAGGVGTMAVQIAKAFGANVTGVCSTRNVDLVRSIGADLVIDYTKENFTERAERYDVFLDAIGNHSLAACRHVLRGRGTYIAIAGPDGRWLGPLRRLIEVTIVSPFVRHRTTSLLAKRSTSDLSYFAGLMESGSLKPVIDRTYPLELSAEAIRYLELGHARGKVVVTVVP